MKKTQMTCEQLEPRQMMAGFGGAEPDFVCADKELQALYLKFDMDSKIDRSEFVSLCNSAADGGVVDKFELSDLRNIVAKSCMAADVKNLATKVLNDAPVTSSDIQYSVGKWFYGNNRPSLSGFSNVSYQPVQGSLFVDGVKSTDVKQGAVGDCYLLASLGALADKYNTVVNTMFNDNLDGTWSVRFYKIDGTRYVEDYVTVDRFLPVNSYGSALFADFKKSGTNELWVSLTEKAYAQWARGNSWSKMGGGWSDVVFKEVTGSNSASLFDMSKAEKDITAALANGSPVVIYRYMNAARTSAHAYFVQSYSNGYFTLVNPWGYADLVADINQIKRECYGYAIATRRTPSPSSLAFASLASGTISAANRK